MRFKQRPIEIDAWEWDMAPVTFGRLLEIPGFEASLMESAEKKGVITRLRIKTRKSYRDVFDGDWIIRDVDHGFDVIRFDVFDLLYECAEIMPDIDLEKETCNTCQGNGYILNKQGKLF